MTEYNNCVPVIPTERSDKGSLLIAIIKMTFS